MPVKTEDGRRVGEENFLKIKGILFSEFDVHLGNALRFQVPLDCVSEMEFSNVQKYIITKQPMQGKLVTIISQDHRILGCPVFIRDEKYPRNKIIFNVCLVLDGRLDDISMYEPIVRKLARYFTSMELESGFLFTPETHAKIPEILAAIFTQLNDRGECHVRGDESTTLHLQLRPKYEVSRLPVTQFDVPCLRVDPERYMVDEWDMSTKHILPFINGVASVGRIAQVARMDVFLVCLLVQDLQYLRIVQVMPPFLYRNVYATTPHLPRLYYDQAFRKLILRNASSEGRPEPDFTRVLEIFSACQVDTNMMKIVNEFKPCHHGIDIRRLIHIGVFHGIIRRMECYPVRVDTPGLLQRGATRSFQLHRSAPLSTDQKRLYPLCTGQTSLDYLCAHLSMPHKDLLSFIEKDPHLKCLWV